MAASMSKLPTRMAWRDTIPPRAITAVSVLVAFLVGGIEIAGLLSTELHLHGGLADATAGVDLNTAGYLMVALFLAVWAVAALVWRLARLETRGQASTAEDAGTSVSVEQVDQVERLGACKRGPSSRAT